MNAPYYLTCLCGPHRIPREATFTSYEKAMRAAKLFVHIGYGNDPQYIIYQNGALLVSTYREGRLD